MPFPFSHIIFQSGAVFVVGFFLIFYFLTKVTERSTSLFLYIGEEDFRTKLLSQTISFPSLEGIAPKGFPWKGWVVFVRNGDLQIVNNLITNH